MIPACLYSRAATRWRHPHCRQGADTSAQNLSNVPLVCRPRPMYNVMCARYLIWSQNRETRNRPRNRLDTPPVGGTHPHNIDLHLCCVILPFRLLSMSSEAQKSKAFLTDASQLGTCMCVPLPKRACKKSERVGLQRTKSRRAKKQAFWFQKKNHVYSGHSPFLAPF